LESVYSTIERSGKKRAPPIETPTENALEFFHRQTVLMMMVGVAAFGGIDDGLDDTIGHTHADDTQRIPQTAMKHIMANIPNPFKADKR
jgi:hypothetical protein